MFYLVRYEDGILDVLSEKYIRRTHTKSSAKYKNGIYHACTLLFSHEDHRYLRAMEHQLTENCLVVFEKCEDFNAVGTLKASSNSGNAIEIVERQQDILQHDLPLTHNEESEEDIDQSYQISTDKYEGCQRTTDDQNYHPTTDDQYYLPASDESDDNETIADDDYDYQPSSDEDNEYIEPLSHIEDNCQPLMNAEKVHTQTSSEQPMDCEIELPVSNEPFFEEIRNISINENPVGDAIKNSETTLVKSSDSGTKKYSCKYCHKLVAKLARHIETVHRDEDEVKQLRLISKVKRQKNKSLSESAKGRLAIINKIRAKGNFQHNMKCSTNDDFIPCRRPRKNKPAKTVSTFSVCPLCKDTFSKSTLHKHYKKCSGQSSKYNRQIQTLSRETVGNIHEKAEPLLRKIVSCMREDDVTRVIRYDLLVILFGNLESYKYRHSLHHSKMIRAKLRRLGRLLLELRRLQTNITDFASLFNASYFNYFLKAVNNLGNFNEETDLYNTPGTAFALGSLTKELADIWIADCIEKKDPERKKAAEEFMHLYNLKVGKIVNKTVSESQSEMRIKKKVVLPSLKDIKVLHKFLVDKRTFAFQQLLKNGFNFKMWKELLETTLISIQLLNRRRAGEIERLKLVHYESIEKIDENSNLDLYKNLSPSAKIIAKKYSRILLRGKLNRTVPVLLTNEMVDCINAILKYRNDANVAKTNPYLFGIPGGRQNIEKWPNACDLMRKFSLQCNAQLPSTLRGTLLRKHVATCCISLDLTNGEVEDLSKFMGHDKNIHLNIYRQPVARKDILEISQLLEKVQGEEDFTDIENQNISSENIDMLERNEDETNNSFVMEQIPEFKTPASSKTKWDPQSCAAVMNAFGEKLLDAKLPSSYEIQQAIISSPCLRKRTVPQVRAWLHSKKKIIISQKTDDSSKTTPQKRNRIPNTIYLLFANNIATKRIPNLTECYAMYSKSPTLDKYNPMELQNLVKEAIEKCD